MQRRRYKYEGRPDPVRCLGEPTEGALHGRRRNSGVENDAEMDRIVHKREKGESRSPRAAPSATRCRRRTCTRRLAVLEFDRVAKVHVRFWCAKTRTHPCRLRLVDRARHEKDQSRGFHARHQRAVRQGRARERARAVTRRCSAPDGSVAPLSASAKKQIVDQTAAMSKNALRVLGFAVKSGADLGVLRRLDGTWATLATPVLKDPSSYEAVESDLTFSHTGRHSATRRARKSPAPQLSAPAPASASW